MATPDPLYVRADGTKVVATNGVGKVEIRWPPGFHAAFDPAFVGVQTDTGVLVVKANDDINTPSEEFGRLRICFEGNNGVDVYLKP